MRVYLNTLTMFIKAVCDRGRNANADEAVNEGWPNRYVERREPLALAR